MIMSKPGVGQETMSLIADRTIEAFRPFSTSFHLSGDRRRVVLAVGDREYEDARPCDDASLKETVHGLMTRARDALWAAGWEREGGRWINPETADFLRTEPHPVTL